MYLVVFKFADYFLFIMGRGMHETLLNPFTPEISLVILLTNCCTIFMILVLRICYWIN